jgi:2-keto-4-pentenoate hydratase
MQSAEHEAAARSLKEAHDTRRPIAPVVESYPQATATDAYEIQTVLISLFTAEGHRRKGHKVGLTSAAMQRMLGVDQPDFGVLLDMMFHADGGTVPTGRFIAPRVEPEIAFVLGRDLVGPGVTPADAVAAVDFALPALEIIDSRIAEWKISLIDTIADNASSGGVVLGSDAVSVRGLDLRRLGCNMWRNGALVATGAGGAVMGNPLNALVWLANTLGAFGTVLRAGEVVMPGSITAACPVAPGDVVSASFAGLGGVGVRFERKVAA